ncbi:MAG TPA: hypothetical protein PK634_08840, partial [Kiritimatiellia bacterium]|nr:hypothetical protein [Kiritimatiellia bacterium]
MKSKVSRWGLIGLLLGCWVATAGAGEVTVRFEFSADDVSLVAVDGYQRLALADGSLPVDEVGAPAIPARYANILVPAGAE